MSTFSGTVTINDNDLRSHATLNMARATSPRENDMFYTVEVNDKYWLVPDLETISVSDSALGEFACLRASLTSALVAR